MPRALLAWVPLAHAALSLCACARAPPPATAPAPREPLLSVKALLATMGQTCSGPEGVELCAPSQFEETFHDQLPSLIAHRDPLREAWLAQLERGDHSAAYGLAWASDKRAIAPLRRGLLEERYFYGWESSDAATLEARMRDDQYPRHQARIIAIERLTGQRIGEAITLRAHERARLWREAFAEGEFGGPPDVARWLLVRFTVFVMLDRPLVVVSRATCDAWDFELHGITSEGSHP